MDRHMHARYLNNIVITVSASQILSVSEKTQRTNGPENAHLKSDLGALSHHDMTLTWNTYTPLLTS